MALSSVEEGAARKIEVELGGYGPFLIKELLSER